MSEIVDVCIAEFDDAGCEPMVLFWYVEAGDPVVTGQDLCEIESAKAVTVITAPEDGILTEILAGEGDPVASGQVLAKITVS